MRRGNVILLGVMWRLIPLSQVKLGFRGWPSMTLLFFDSRLFFILLIFAAFGVVVPHQLLVVFVPL
ncbi:hypothetical protein F2Q70_00008480 [Brassica cretica]|uniref:Uncharacterized protein n=1 Tax=Brassica cretica TaxID=69181 RepID=A0A8S9JE29_BRACR|nr:hypothetical protein F2Q68_00001512 [Brassica cretica]KAF2613799.1 hypothetical protein F2Q70_00008480 [Brassica cretica]